MKLVQEAEKLVAKTYPGYVIGTQICRVFAPTVGIEWSVGLGLMGRPLWFGRGQTIEEATCNAMKEFKACHQ